MDAKISQFISLLKYAPDTFYSPISRDEKLTQNEIDIRSFTYPELRISHNEIIVRKFHQLTEQSSYSEADVNTIFAFLNNNQIEKTVALIYIERLNKEILTLLTNKTRILFNPY